ncbi:hypothetical protein AM24_051 [Acinetobacter phage AM24]|nr:hypothetical protein AM24_051 [Acinetobacter phage AM24]
MSNCLEEWYKTIGVESAAHKITPTIQLIIRSANGLPEGTSAVTGAT